jgi:hypothetical protein
MNLPINKKGLWNVTKLVLAIFCISIGIVYLWQNIYCQFISPDNCIEHNIGNEGIWFQYK